MTKTKSNFCKTMFALFVCALLAIAVAAGVTATTAKADGLAIDGGKLFLKEESYGISDEWCTMQMPTSSGVYKQPEVPVMTAKKAPAGTADYDYIIEWNKTLAAYRSVTACEWTGINLYYGVEDGENHKVSGDAQYFEAGNANFTLTETKIAGKTSPILELEMGDKFMFRLMAPANIDTSMETLLTISGHLPGDNTALNSVKILFKVVEDDDIFAPLTFSWAQEAGPDRHMVLVYYGNDYSISMPGGQLNDYHSKPHLTPTYTNVLMGKNAVDGSAAVAPVNVGDYKGASGNVRINWHMFGGYLEFIRYEGANDTTGTAFEKGEYVIVKKGFMIMDPRGACMPDSNGKVLRTEQDLKFVFNIDGNLSWTEVYGIKSVTSEKEEDSVGMGQTLDLTDAVSVEGNVKASDGGEFSTDLVWTSEDTSIATVSDGVVTGVAKGTTFIVATSAVDGSKSVRIKVRVIGDDEVGAINFTADWSSYKVLNLDLDDSAKKSAVVKCYVSGGENADLTIKYAVNQEGVAEITTAEKTDADGTKYTEITVNAKKPCSAARVTVTSVQNEEVSNFFTINVTGTPASDSKPGKKGCGCGSSVAGVASIAVALGLLACASVMFFVRKRKNA